MNDADTSAVSPRWEDPRTVAGFTAATPNGNLLAFARAIFAGTPDARCLDIGCGAARNALPLAEMGFRVTATDLSVPMSEFNVRPPTARGSGGPPAIYEGTFVRGPGAALPADAGTSSRDREPDKVPIRCDAHHVAGIAPPRPRPGGMIR